METKPTGDDFLKVMFQHLPEEKLSVSFRQEVMMRIQLEALRVQRRNAILRTVALSVASFLIIGLSVMAFVFLKMPFPEWHIPQLSIPPLWLFIGVATLILLFVDYWLRRNYFKKHPNLK